MTLSAIPLDSLRKVGLGVQRPEDVVVSRAGRVWLSDQASACAEVLPDGSLRRVGRAGGAPNGINMDAHGRIVIANFGGPEDGRGPLQRLDPETGDIEVLCGEIAGRALYGSNYPVIDTQGRIWCSHSTWGPIDRAFAGRDDGLVFRVDPDGAVTVVAEGIAFANGLALDPEEAHLFVCETTGCDVLRYPIRGDGSLGEPSRYGPKLGLSHAEVKDRRPLSPALRSELGLTDGCGFDQAGNLWVTLPMSNKVVAILPSGEVTTVVSDPGGILMRSPTNVTWGGADLCDLYIGSIATDYVLHARTEVPGVPLIHQRA